MKQKHTIILTSVLCISLLSGCGNATATDSKSSAEKEGVVLTASSEADFTELASTLDELIASSDFIAKVKVTETSAYVYPETDMIDTLITPEILEIYKGSYNGEKLELCGGYMSYKDYYSAPVFQGEDAWHTFDASAYTEEELETAQVYWDWCNSYVPVADDTIIFFGNLLDTGNYYLTNGYQGLFRLNGDSWTNQAIANDDSYQDPLADDLLSLSGAESVSCDTATTFRQNEITYTLPKSAYDSVIAIPEDTLTTRISDYIQA